MILPDMDVEIRNLPDCRNFVDRIGLSALKEIIRLVEASLPAMKLQELSAVVIDRVFDAESPVMHSTLVLVCGSGSRGTDGAGRVQPWTTSLSFRSKFRLVSNCIFSSSSFSSVQFS